MIAQILFNDGDGLLALNAKRLTVKDGDCSRFIPNQSLKVPGGIQNPRNIGDAVQARTGFRVATRGQKVITCHIGLGGGPDA